MANVRVRGQSSDPALYKQLRQELAELRHQPGTTLDMLHAVQRLFGYLEPTAMGMVAETLNITKAQLYGVATFYTMFNFEPKPPIIVRVCVNLSCHLRGAQEVLHALEKAAAEQPDRFEVQHVMCLGLCEQAPALLINEEAVGLLSPEEVLKKVQARVEAVMQSQPIRG